MNKNHKEAPKDTSSNESIVPNKLGPSDDAPTRVKDRKKIHKKKHTRSTNKRRLCGGGDDGPEDNVAQNKSVRMNDSSMAGPQDNSAGGPEDNASRSGPVDHHSRSGPVDHNSQSGPVDHHSRSGPVDHHSQSRSVDHHSQSGPVDLHSRSGPVDLHQSDVPVDHQSSTLGGPVDLHASTPSRPGHLRSGVEGPEDNLTHESHEGPVDLHPGQATLPSTGEPRIDEMLDCALQNLAAANSALASLGENLEHDLKLSLVELMNRTRKWTSQVESKIEWSRKDIMNLHQELAKIMAALKESRRESSMLRDQLSSSEAAMKSMAESSMNETMRNGQKLEKTGNLLAASGFHGEPSTRSELHSTAPSAVRSVQLDNRTGLLSPRSQSRSHIMSAAMAKVSGSPEPPELPTIHAEEERLQACCAELEAEVLELRKENERIVKERAEYENAIQRALLKGVSSLNVEALKVLKCTPIPNCCSPCPPSSTIEPVSKPRDCSTPMSSSGMKSTNDNKSCNNGRSATAASGCRSNNGSREALYNGNGRRVCPSAGHHQERKQRKSRDKDMLLLLHQKDAENYGIQTGSNCYDNSAKKSSACGGGGNCGNKYSKSSYMC